MKLTRQQQKVYDILKDGEWHSNRTFIHSYGLTRVPASVNEMRELGIEIETSTKDEHGFVSYRLKQIPTPIPQGKIEIVNGKALFVTS